MKRAYVGLATCSFLRGVALADAARFYVAWWVLAALTVSFVVAAFYVPGLSIVAGLCGGMACTSLHAARDAEARVLRLSRRVGWELERKRKARAVRAQEGGQ